MEDVYHVPASCLPSRVPWSAGQNSWRKGAMRGKPREDQTALLPWEGLLKQCCKLVSLTCLWQKSWGDWTSMLKATSVQVQKMSIFTLRNEGNSNRESWYLLESMIKHLFIYLVKIFIACLLDVWQCIVHHKERSHQWNRATGTHKLPYNNRFVQSFPSDFASLLYNR